MRITVIGSGGVGGYFGARLAQGGCDVGFVARGSQLKAMQTDGLRIESPLGNVHLSEVRASDDPAALGRPDAILISVKLWDTEAAVRAIAPAVGPDTFVVSLQNGVQKDEVLRALLGNRPVVGGVCYISAEIRGPGVIVHSGVIPRLVVGEYDGTASSRVAGLVERCKAGGIDAEIAPDIRRATWEKFVFLVGFSAATTVLDATIGPIRADVGTRALLLGLMREVVQVGRARGIALAEGFPENRLSFCDTLPPDTTSSMHRDFQKGHRLEVEWLSGAVAELGSAVGIDAPLNRAVYAILTFRSANPEPHR